MAAYPYQPQYNNQMNYSGYNQMQTPQYTNTYMPQTIAPMQSQPIDNLIRVTGLDGAKAYQLPPNSSIALFDANNDIMYIKTTDGAGFPSIKAFTFSPIEANTAQETTYDYVQRPEFDALVEQVRGLINGEQSISKSANSTAKRAAKQSNQCD